MWQSILDLPSSSVYDLSLRRLKFRANIRSRLTIKSLFTRRRAAVAQ
jgi:hypothetical protein